MHADDNNANLPQKRLRSARIVWGVLGVFAISGLVLLWLVDPAETHLPLCSFHALTGMHCPGCGLTRATHALLHGRFFEALRDNALWVVLLPLAAWIGLGELWRQRKGRPPRVDLLRSRWFYIVMGAVAIAFFLLRNLPGWPWELLRPMG